MYKTNPTLSTPRMLLLGITLSVAGNLCIGLGFQSHAIASSHTLLFWRLGCALMATGECLNFAAYGLAPASVVVSFDAIAFMVSQMGVGCTRASQMGAGMVVAGVAGAVLNAPQADEEGHDAVQCIASWRAGLFLAVVGAAGLWVANPLNLAIAVSHSTRRSYVLCYCFLSGMMGMFTVVGAKGLSTALARSTAAHLHSWPVYAMLMAAIVAPAALQMRFIGAALEAGFRQGIVVPVYYVCFTAIAVSAGAVVFRETVFASSAHPVLFGASLMLVYAGLFTIGRDRLEAMAVVDDGGKGGGV